MRSRFSLKNIVSNIKSRIQERITNKTIIDGRVLPTNLVRKREKIVKKIQKEYTKELRKDMKKKFYRKTRYVNLNKKFRSLASYWGWCKYGNCFNLWKRFTGTNSIKELKILLLGYDKNCT